MSLTDTIQILKDLTVLSKESIQREEQNGKNHGAMVLVDLQDVEALEEALDRLEGIKRIQRLFSLDVEV